MKTFKEFLTEEENPADIVDMIIRDCQPFLEKASTTNSISYIYRGMNSDREFIEKSIRKNRKPKSTSEEFHNIINQWFYNKFGVNARSESLFVKGKTRTLDFYGKIYTVFPIGEFDFVWSNIVEDLFNIVEPIEDDLEFDPTSYDEAYKKMWKALDNANYQNDDFRKAILSGNEIMIIGNSYYAVEEYYFRTYIKETLEDELFNKG